MQAVYSELQSLRLIHPKARTPEEEAQILGLEERRQAIIRQFMNAFDQALAAFAQVDEAAHQRLARQHLRLGNDRRGIVAEFGRAMLVQYLVLEDQLRILVTTPAAITPRSRLISAEAVNRLVWEYYTRLRQRWRDPRPLAQELYSVLLAPIDDLLEASRPELLMFSLDGTLRYLPMAALHDGRRYLIERTAVTLFAETDSEQLLLPPQQQWRAAAFGVSESHEGFSPLPAVTEEIDGIVRNSPRDPLGVLDGFAHLDSAFTASSLRRRLQDKLPVVHLVTHFRFKPGTESDSFLLLGDGRRLDLGALRTGDFPFTDVDLVTLSAYETAVGGANSDGKEIDGLGTLIRRLGAKSVIATLWPR